MNIFAVIGRVFLAFLAQTGRLTLFMIDGVTSVLRPPIYWSLIGQQMLRIGYFRCRSWASPHSSPAARWRSRFTSAATASVRNRSCRTSSCSASRANWGR
jgi:hypothetical protein